MFSYFLHLNPFSKYNKIATSFSSLYRQCHISFPTPDAQRKDQDPNLDLRKCRRKVRTRIIIIAELWLYDTARGLKFINLLHYIPRILISTTDFLGCNYSSIQSIFHSAVHNKTDKYASKHSRIPNSVLNINIYLRRWSESPVRRKSPKYLQRHSQNPAS